MHFVWNMTSRWQQKKKKNTLKQYLWHDVVAESDTFLAMCNLDLLHVAGPAPAISRLGINPYQWGTECLSGDVGAGPATSFPQAIGMVRRVGSYYEYAGRALTMEHTIVLGRQGHSNGISIPIASL